MRSGESSDAAPTAIPPSLVVAGLVRKMWPPCEFTRTLSPFLHVWVYVGVEYTVHDIHIMYHTVISCCPQNVAGIERKFYMQVVHPIGF